MMKTKNCSRKTVPVISMHTLFFLIHLRFTYICIYFLYLIHFVLFIILIFLHKSFVLLIIHTYCIYFISLITRNKQISRDIQLKSKEVEKHNKKKEKKKLGI